MTAKRINRAKNTLQRPISIEKRAVSELGNGNGVDSAAPEVRTDSDAIRQLKQ